MVLVVGATGLVGLEICQRLARNGENVRALVRPTSAKEKVQALESWGVELAIGDLKDPASIHHACSGVDAVISTASSTLSRQPGDTIESVDGAGQLNLVNTAKSLGVERFIFVSFRHSPHLTFPLGGAKLAAEAALESMNFTIIQASWFMEVWLSPALGFDYPNAAARIYGPGLSPVSWVSYRDVAEMACLALRHPAAERQTIEFGGPEALSPLDVVKRFEAVHGKTFQLDHIPEEALRAQLASATDSLQKSFATLMLGFVYGDAIDMRPVVEKFGIKLASLDDYVNATRPQGADA